jgi:flagellar basal body-associated protein FliL
MMQNILIVVLFLIAVGGVILSWRLEHSGDPEEKNAETEKQASENRKERDV